MSKHKRPFDQNLVDAINKISWPLTTANGTKVFLRSNTRDESGAEHISGKLHNLKVRDISLIPEIMNNPIKIKRDKRKGKLYFAKRKGVNKKSFLKIVVRELEDKEVIITICSTKKCS